MPATGRSKTSENITIDPFTVKKLADSLQENSDRKIVLAHGLILIENISCK
jgi:hypothetical protein